MKYCNYERLDGGGARAGVLHEGLVYPLAALPAGSDDEDAARLSGPIDPAALPLLEGYTHRLMSASLFGYNKKCSFGMLTFDTTAPDPIVNYKIINIDNELVHTFPLKKSQLTHKKTNNDR